MTAEKIIKRNLESVFNAIADSHQKLLLFLINPSHLLPGPPHHQSDQKLNIHSFT